MSQITQKGATGGIALQAAGSFQTSTDSNFATVVGTRWDLSDGREVILVSNGAVAVGSPGVLLQDAALIANHLTLAVTAFTAYSANGNTPPSVTVTLGATSVAANQYQGGFLVVNSGIGIGQTLRIASHPGAAASASLVVTLEDGPNTALTTASVVSLIPPHGANVVVFPTTPTNVPVGITLYGLAAGLSAGSVGTPLLGFALSKGIVAAVSDVSAPVVGAQIIPSVTTAGNIAASTGTGVSVIGYTAVAATSAQAKAVFVNL